MQITIPNPILPVIAFGILCLFGIALYTHGSLMQYLNAHAYATTEQTLGSQRLASAQEEKIHAIAREMGIYEPFHLRKMNRDALISFGYHNAFAYVPTFLYFIPIKSTPFLYISEGFFEDLRAAEQRFLIGHELVHIQERHFEYMVLFMLALKFYLVFIWWRSRKHIKEFVLRYLPARIPSNLWIIPNMLLLYCCLQIPTIGALAYRRQIEWHADRKSLEILKSYDGCIQFMNRVECDFQVPARNAYFGLIADHPSCTERKNYCLTFQNTSKDAR